MWSQFPSSLFFHPAFYLIACEIEIELTKYSTLGTAPFITIRLSPPLNNYQCHHCGESIYGS